MLFRKKEKEEPLICAGCGCLVAQGHAHEVVTNPATGYYCPVSYYCGICAPPYNKKIEDTLMRPKYFTLVSEHYEEVTEEGKPIKKK